MNEWYYDVAQYACDVIIFAMVAVVFYVKVLS